jgi:hypothetical protein
MLTEQRQPATQRRGLRPPSAPQFQKVRLKKPSTLKNSFCQSMVAALPK